MGVNGEALQLHTVYKEPYFLLQVTLEFVSGTTSHMSASECAMKSKVRMIITIVPSYTGKKYHSFVGAGNVTRAAHS